METDIHSVKKENILDDLDCTSDVNAVVEKKVAVGESSTYPIVKQEDASLESVTTLSDVKEELSTHTVIKEELILEQDYKEDHEQEVFSYNALTVSVINHFITFISH